MPRPKKVNVVAENNTEEVSELEEVPESKEPSEKEKLLLLYQTLKDMQIDSISKLEKMIERAE